VGFIASSASAPDQVLRRGPARHGEHDDIRRRHHLGDRAELRGLHARVLHAGAVVEHDPHPEPALRALRDGLADPAHADHAQRLAGDVHAEELGRLPALPLARAHDPLALARAAAGHQDQRQRDVGGGVGHGARRVRHLDAHGAGGGRVDVVVAHAEVGEDLRARRLLEGLRPRRRRPASG
jgi:hypothetical protein